MFLHNTNSLNILSWISFALNTSPVLHDSKIERSIQILKKKTGKAKLRGNQIVIDDDGVDFWMPRRQRPFGNQIVIMVYWNRIENQN